MSKFLYFLAMAVVLCFCFVLAKHIATLKHELRVAADEMRVQETLLKKGVLAVSEQEKLRDELAKSRREIERKLDDLSSGDPLFIDYLVRMLREDAANRRGEPAGEPSR